MAGTEEAAGAKEISHKWQKMSEFEIIKRPQGDEGKLGTVDLSVVVPTCNMQDYLGACLNSLTTQGDLRLELIVVDYKSTDSTLLMVDAFSVAHPNIPVTVVQQNTSGLGDARNFGIGCASGEYVAFLDSDDFFSPHAYWEMVDHARTHDCDLVFCRGVVFEDLTSKSHFFYDDWVWDEILGKRYSYVTNVLREPRLFRLEPNASVRIMRRKFLLDKNILYPTKKRAEDLVPHYISLFEADRIGVISTRGFFYRVGRAGKLTDDASKWVCDLLDAIATAISESFHYEPSDAIGEAMIYLCVRSAFGYGSQIPFSKRWTYYRSAGMIFAQLPRRWVCRALTNPMHPDMLQNIRMKIALLALRAQDTSFLVFLSGAPSGAVSIFMRLVSRPAMLFFLLRQYWKLAFSKVGIKSLMECRHG
ncbi:MAG: glycosyltransferase family 2 protein [Acidiferrobacterales bacterium]